MKRLGFFVICSCCCVVQAATPDITFHGTLVSPPVCTISGGKTIEVDFGDILINDIDGVNFRQTVPYEITCDSGVRDAVWEMTLTWKGTPTNYNTSAVQTSVTDLGIEMQQNGSPFELDKPLSIDPASPPMLKAVPVKASGAVLGDGAFSAYATLQVDYQ
ncbi:fimbrial protein [Escherichia sp. E4694]|uniref:fimbrial protein n=1 Tax=Escherichia sp. E4694 TaxID=2044464 RepID=UPI001080D04F|nr:fimbrial protein [Escherichia sp. E4694]TGB76295.1 fimbrial protein [Escherichia sp. E4694]